MFAVMQWNLGWDIQFLWFRDEAITRTNIDVWFVRFCGIQTESHFQTAILYNVLWKLHIDGLAQNCSNSIANALELLQSCT